MSASALQEKVNNLPDSPGVYFFKNRNGKIVYIGKANSLRNRVRSYFQNGRNLGSRKELMVRQVVDFEITITDSEVEALILEGNLIKEHHPKYNVSFRDDKSFPYIRVTNEQFPRVFPTRKKVNDGSIYYGPYTDVKAMRQTLRMIRKLFPVRSCNYQIDDEAIARGKIKLCLDYHIHKCPGPCEGLISAGDYAAIINQMKAFLQGKTAQVLDFFNVRMKNAAQDLKFEEAARYRDHILALEGFAGRQKVVGTEDEERDILSIALEGEIGCGIVFRVRDGKLLGRQHFILNSADETEKQEAVSALLRQYYMDADYVPAEILIPCELEDRDVLLEMLEKKRGGKVIISVPKAGQKAQLLEMCAKNAVLLLEEMKFQKTKKEGFIPYPVQVLQKELSLPVPPRNIEAFDISNTMGKQAVGSMVSFYDGKPKKSEYRRFRIKLAEGPNDFAMMKEVVSRRYQRLIKEGKSLPDLILIDGGKGQLNAAIEVLDNLGVSGQSVAGLAKRFEEVFLPGMSEPQSIRKDSSGLKLLQKIRDESHRFAITYHKRLRDAMTSLSALDEIPGIGKMRKQILLRHFRSLSRLENAGVDDIAGLDGFNKVLAEKIIEYLAQRKKHGGDERG